MNNPSFTISPKHDKPILLVDKKGFLGAEFAKRLSQNFIVILVSGYSEKEGENIIHVPYVKKIPVIPDNFYSDIFLFDDGFILEKSISSFLKKAKADSSNLILVESIRGRNEKVIEEVKSYRNSTIIFYADLFCENQILSEAGKILSQVKKDSKIQIEGDGLSPLYPIYLSDFVDVTIEQKFIRQNSNKIINIFPKNPITKLSFARLIQSINPLLKIDFIKAKQDLLQIPGGDFVLGNYDLKDRVKKVLEKDQTADFEQNEPLEERIEEKKYLRGSVLLILFFVLFLLLLPGLTTLFYGYLGLFEIDSMKGSLQKGDFSKALSSAKNSQNFFSFALRTLGPLKSEARIIGKEKDLSSIEGKMKIGHLISKASVNLILSAIKIEKIVNGGAVDPKSDFGEALSLMKDSISSFRSFEARKKEFPDIEKKISDIEEGVNLLSASIDVVPSLLGFDREMAYLVLFQNNMELRPGGGFIGSYGLLSVKNARVTDFKISDVYSADGQIKGHVEPPFPIRRYLPQPNWYLRDSNFDPDFSADASSSAFFLDLETGQKVDGVIAVDLSFLRNLLSVIGSVNVSDYNVTIDAANFFQVIEDKTSKNFFSGSTQKKDFLQALFKSMQDSFSQKRGISYLSLVKVISSALLEKHLLLASNQSFIQDVFSVNNWSSQISDIRPSKDGVFNDYLGISEANLGISKVNSKISRSVAKAQIIDQSGKLSGAITLSYKNESSDTSYKNYLRLILPKDAALTQISFDNVSQQILAPITDPAIYECKNFKKPAGLEVDQTIKYDKKLIGFLVEIPSEGLKNVSVTYELPQVLILGPKIDYSLKIYKQPGVGQYPLEFSLYYPVSYAVLNAEKGSEVLENKLSLGKNVSKDETINLSLTQK